MHSEETRIRERCSAAVKTDKFAGQPVFVPYFWWKFEEGYYERTPDGREEVIVQLTEDDLALFPELLRHWPDDQTAALLTKLGLGFPEGSRPIQIYLRCEADRVRLSGMTVDKLGTEIGWF